MSEASSVFAHPVAALGAYVEPIVRGRRVAVLGDATSGLGELLLERGARLVHVYDRDPGRVAEAAARASADAALRRPVVARLVDDLGVRDGAFDVVVVADVPAVGPLDEVVRRARRLVGNAGVAVLASPNPECTRGLVGASQRAAIAAAPSYYDLFDGVSLQFSEVRMLGQAPFVGYAIVDFAEAEPEVSVDTSLLEEPEQPEWYVVVASDRRLTLDAYALVEVPSEVLTTQANHAPAPRTERVEPATPRISDDQITVVRELPELGEREVVLREANARNAVLSAEVEKLRESLAEAQRGADDGLMEQLVEAQRAEESLRRKVGELEVRLLEEHHRAEAAVEGSRNASLDAMRARAELEELTARRVGEAASIAAENAQLRGDLGAARARVGELEATLEADAQPTLRSREVQLRIARLEAREQELLGAVAQAERDATSRAAELDRATKRTLELEEKLARTKRREAEFSSELEPLKQRAFELESELEGALARVTELEDELGAAESRAAGASTAVEAVRSEHEALTTEIARLEGALRERGRTVARLEAELREGERVGRELLLALEAAGGLASDASGSGGAPPPSPARGSRENGSAVIQGASSAAAPRDAVSADAVSIDGERAARVEADLVAASWRIAQLERELARRSRPEATPTAREHELERALVLAQREIAESRGRLGREDGASTTDAP
jgi:hypothetical protein